MIACSRKRRWTASARGEKRSSRQPASRRSAAALVKYAKIMPKRATGVARRLAHHRDALAVERADPALEERLHRGRLLEQRALQQARQVRVAGQVRGQPIERRMHALGPEAVLPRDRHRLDDRSEPALEDRVVERLLAGEVVVEARGGDPHLARQVAHRDTFHAARREQALGRVEDDLAGGGGRTLPSPAPCGRRRHGGRCNERTFVASSPAQSPFKVPRGGCAQLQFIAAGGQPGPSLRSTGREIGPCHKKLSSERCGGEA